MTTKIIIRDRFYVSLSRVNHAAIHEHFSVANPTKEHCRPQCPIANKPNRYCSTCPGKDHRIKMWEVMRLRSGRKVVALSSGDRDLLKRVLLPGPVVFVDRRPDVPFRSNLRWTGKLRRKGDVDSDGNPTADQRGMVRAWVQHVKTGESGGMIISPPRCVTGDTLILTTQGITRIDEWIPKKLGWSFPKLPGSRAAMSVVLESGSAVLVSKTFTSSPERVIRVTVRGGLTIKGRRDHPIFLKKGFTKLRDVQVGNVIPVFFGQNIWGVQNSISTNTAKLLGFWVSEGRTDFSGRHRTTCVGISNHDQQILQFCYRELKNLCSAASVSFGHDKRRPDVVFTGVGSRDKNLHKIMDDLIGGLWRRSAEQEIPKIVLRSNREIVCAFLQALFEGDGSVGRKSVSYASLSRTLIHQIQIVLANLGIISSVRKRWSWATNGSVNQVSKPYWCLAILGPGVRKFREDVGFFSPRKSKALDAAVKYYETRGYQPQWFEVYPVCVKREFMSLIRDIDSEWSHFKTMNTYKGGFSRGKVSFATQVMSKARLGDFKSKALTRQRLTRYCNLLVFDPRWHDLSDQLRSRILMFRDKYLNPNCYWTVIKHVDISNSPVVTYDVHVPRHHRFMSNGLLSHNTGKTAMGVASICHMQKRAFITAAKIDWLRQFCMRFGELTNVRQLARNGRSPVVLIDPKGWPDAPKYGTQVVRKWSAECDKADVVLSCYQQLIADHGEIKLRKYVHGRFPTFVVDEADMSAPTAFSRLSNRLDFRYGLGLTATSKRRDGLDHVVGAIIGKVVAKGKAVSTLPTLEIFETGVQCNRNFKSWNGIVNFLSALEARNKVIVQQVFKDLRSDKKACILIPVVRVAHVHMLVKMINAQAEYNRANRGEDWPRELAVAYYGKSDTNAVLKQVRAGRARVVISNTSMSQRGLDVSRWTHVYIGVIPTSNAALTWQLINRVCTPYANELKAKIGSKPKPVARIIIDPLSASVFCFAKVWKDKDYGYLAGLQGTNLIEHRCYGIKRDSFERLKSIAEFPKSYQFKGENVYAENKHGHAIKHHVWQRSPSKGEHGRIKL